MCVKKYFLFLCRINNSFIIASKYLMAFHLKIYSVCCTLHKDAAVVNIIVTFVSNSLFSNIFSILLNITKILRKCECHNSNANAIIRLITLKR